MAKPTVRLRLQVEVISPVHIGSGEKFSRKSFLYGDGKVTIINSDKLIQEVIKRDAHQQFEEFCLDPNSQLGEFLRKTGIRVADVAAYTIPCSTRPREILAFIKSRENQPAPFLPGSSLKGAIRSALLRAYLLSNADARQTGQEALKDHAEKHWGNPGQQVERGFFIGTKCPRPGKAPNYDLLRMISVSDSPALSVNALAVAQVSVLSTQTNRTLKAKTWQLTPEVLKPGTVIQMALTVNINLKEPRAMSVLGLRDVDTWVLDFAGKCRKAAENLLAQDQKFYNTHSRGELADWCRARIDEIGKMGAESETTFLPIGWGSGYDAKTVTDLFAEKVFENTLSAYKNTKRLGRPGGTGRWLGPDLSPKTRRVAVLDDGQELPMGWIRLRVIG